MVVAYVALNWDEGIASQTADRGEFPKINQTQRITTSTTGSTPCTDALLSSKFRITRRLLYPLTSKMLSLRRNFMNFFTRGAGLAVIP